MSDSGGGQGVRPPPPPRVPALSRVPLVQLAQRLLRANARLRRGLEQALAMLKDPKTTRAQLTAVVREALRRPKGMDS